MKWSEITSYEIKEQWSMKTASEFMDSIVPLLRNNGLRATIVGSVASRGFSSKDLDIFIEPLDGCDHEKVADWVYNILVPRVSGSEKPSDPLDYDDCLSFINIGTSDGRSIDIFFNLNVDDCNEME